MSGSWRARTLCWGALGLAAAWFGLEARAANYDFSYRLSGDRRVAPIQVFDDGQQTWLQFAPGQVMPAVFVQQANQALQLAAYQQQGPYLVLQGTAPQIDLRIGDIMARAEYTGTVARQTSVSAVPQPLSSTPSSVALPALASAERAARRPVSALPESPRLSHEMSAQTPESGAPSSAVSSGSLPPATAVRSGEAALEFDAALSDRNMRRVLERWARQVGWTFQAEHWTVDVDIPLVGAASFGSDFRNAVRGLLAATELGERPLQPCFYSNRVLRVIALSQACDRTAAPMALADRG